MKRKSILAFLLIPACIFTMAFTMSACGNNDTDNKGNNEQTDGEQENNQGGNNQGNENQGNENQDNENQGNENQGKEAFEYYFEAECTDLTDLTGDTGSGTAYHKELITSGDRAHGGNYVDNFNVVGSTITYTINSDKAATVNMSVLLSALSEGTLDSQLFTVKVNGTAVNYASTTVKDETEKVSAIKSNILFGKIELGEVPLNAGANTITFTVGEKTNASGTGTYNLSLRFDAMVLSSADATLTWNPITDWDTFYPDF